MPLLQVVQRYLVDQGALCLQAALPGTAVYERCATNSAEQLCRLTTRTDPKECFCCLSSSKDFDFVQCTCIFSYVVVMATDDVVMVTNYYSFWGGADKL